MTEIWMLCYADSIYLTQLCYADTKFLTSSVFYTQWEPDCCGIGRRLLDSSYIFKQSSEHGTRYVKQSIREPRKLTSGTSGLAEFPSSQLPANQNCLRVTCYVRLTNSVFMSSNLISNNNYLAFTSTKRLFLEKSQHYH